MVDEQEIYGDEIIDEVDSEFADVDFDDEVEADDDIDPVDEDLLDDEPDAEDDPEEELEPAAEVVAAPVVAPVATPEVNRLGSVPDLIDEDDSLIELPPITPSGPVVASPQSQYSPVLAETLYIPPPRRAPPRRLPHCSPRRSRSGASNYKASGPKAEAPPPANLMTLVVLFGLLAGGAFAAKKYLLQEPKWTVGAEAVGR